MQILTRFNKVIAYSNHAYTLVGNTAICAATGEHYDDVLITSVDCVPTDINKYEYYYINGKFIKGCSNSEIRETHNQNKLQFWTGTTTEYEALSEKDGNTLYIITDDTTPEDVRQLILRSAKLNVSDWVDVELSGSVYGATLPSTGTYEVIYKGKTNQDSNGDWTGVAKEVHFGLVTVNGINAGGQLGYILADQSSEFYEFNESLNAWIGSCAALVIYGLTVHILTINLGTGACGQLTRRDGTISYRKVFDL